MRSRVDKDDVKWALGDKGLFRCEVSAQPCPALSPLLSLLRIRPIFPVFFAPSRLSYLTLDFRALLDPQLQWRQFGLNKSQSEMNVLSHLKTRASRGNLLHDHATAAADDIVNGSDAIGRRSDINVAHRFAAIRNAE